MVNIRVKDVSSDSGTYEAVGTIDLSQPIPNEPFSLNERIRRRACDQGGDAVGILNTESGTGTEYVILRRRRVSPASSGSSTAKPSIEYFPSSSSTANRPADIR
jgi:hypothetical protein